jgi:hypothetical protein
VRLPIPLVAAWTAMFAGSVYLYFRPAESRSGGSYIATLNQLSGDLEYREPYFSTWRKARPGQAFKAGTAISTGDKATAVVSMKDGQLLSLSANSQIVLGAQTGVGRDLLVSISAGVFSIKKNESAPKSIVDKWTDIIRGSESKLKIQSGSVQVQFDDKAEEVSVARTGGLFSVKSDSEGLAKSMTGEVAKLQADAAVVLKEQNGGSPLLLSGDSREAQVAQQVLDDSLKNIADALKENASTATAAEDPTPTPLPTPVPTPKAYLASDWVLHLPEQNSLAIALQSPLENKYAPLVLALKCKDKIPEDYPQVQLPFLDVLGTPDVLRLKAKRFQDQIVFYELAVNRIAAALAGAKGQLPLRVVLRLPKGSAEENDPKAKVLGDFEILSVDDMPERPYEISLPALAFQQSKAKAWLAARPWKREEASSRPGTFVVAQSRDVLKILLGGLQVTRGVALRPVSAHDGELDVFVSGERVLAGVGSSANSVKNWRSRMATLLGSDLVYQGFMADYLPKSRFLSFLSSTVDDSVEPESVLLKAQGSEFSLLQKQVAEYPSFLQILRELTSLAFVRPVPLVLETTDRAGLRAFAAVANPPASLRRPMPFRKASVAVLVVLEGNERTALSDLKAFGIKTSHLIKAQAESAISLNLRVNGLNERGILKDPNAEGELFDTFQQISRTDLLLVLRKKSDGKTSRRLWGFLETNKATVVEEKGFEKGDSLLRWIARAGGFSAVVSAARDGWARLEYEGVVPAKGQKGFIVAGSNENSWITRFDPAAKVNMLLVCEEPVAAGCLAKVYSVSGKDLPPVGSKVHVVPD